MPHPDTNDRAFFARLQQTLTTALDKLTPEDREERIAAVQRGDAPHGVQAYREEDGWIRYEWGNRVLCRVHRVEATPQNPVLN